MAEKQARTLEKNWLEWTVFGISVVLVIGTLSYLVHFAVTFGDAPPDIHVQAAAAQKTAGGFVIPLTITNNGDLTAEAVQIQVDRRKPDGETESGTMELDYVPRDGTCNGWVFFHGDLAATDSIIAYARSYKAP